jgi:hypothetical protein
MFWTSCRCVRACATAFKPTASAVLRKQSHEIVRRR